MVHEFTQEERDAAPDLFEECPGAWLEFDEEQGEWAVWSGPATDPDLDIVGADPDRAAAIAAANEQAVVWKRNREGGS